MPTAIHSSLAPPAPGVASLARLVCVQREMARLVTDTLSAVDVPLSATAGRVLAEPLVLDAGTPFEARVAPGTPLRPLHVALLASLGRTSVRVFERPRVGIVAWGSRDPASTSAAMLCAAVEEKGAKALLSSCATPDACHLLGSLKALLSAGCSLVLIAGSLDDATRDALEGSGLLRADADVCTVGLESFGSVQLARAPRAHVVSLPADPQAACLAFMVLVCPLLRALSGRADAASPAGPALLVDDGAAPVADRHPFWACERPAPSRCGAARVLRRAGDGLAGIAEATGIAWRPAELDGMPPETVAYLSL